MLCLVFDGHKKNILNVILMMGVYFSWAYSFFCVYKSCWNKCIILPHTLFLLSSHDNIIYNDEFTENEQNVLRQRILRSPVWRPTLFSIIDDIYGCLARELENAIFFWRWLPMFCSAVHLICGNWMHISAFKGRKKTSVMLLTLFQSH